MQVAEAFHRYGKGLGATVAPIYGGQAFDPQVRMLRRGVHVVVATPGRALDHLRRGTLDLQGVAAIVLDEADEMLDMGFADDIEAILSSAPAERQTALFSATLPPRIAKIAERNLKDPVRVNVTRATPTSGTTAKVRQLAYLVSRSQKIDALGRILDVEAPTLALVFCRTRNEVDAVRETLGARGYRAEAIHGGLSQEARDRVMKRTRAGNIDLLIATDVAARGIDIDHLSHVVNYDVPESPPTYVHRIGRTGRAGREGVAITLVEPREHRLMRNIESSTKQRVEITRLPTHHDVQAKRMSLTANAIREAIASGESDHYRVLVESLSDEHDLMEIAMAAVKLAHERGLGGGVRGEDAAPAGRGDEAPRGGGGGEARPPWEARGGAAPRGSSGPMSRIFVGAGRKQNLRPADLVGAIVNEARLPAADIGAIDIADRFALVEVPEDRIGEVIEALRASTIKGKRIMVRRDLSGGSR
jgi:ATP-dependent RNA helicase DeaD